MCLPWAPSSFDFLGLLAKREANGGGGGGGGEGREEEEDEDRIHANAK